MKIMTTSELQKNLGELVNTLSKGEQVLLYKNNKHIGTIKPFVEIPNRKIALKNISNINLGKTLDKPLNKDDLAKIIEKKHSV